MNTSELPNLGNDIDRSQIPPIQQKRILAFVNHFVVNTASFLNTFATQCETKFINCEQKLQKVEASLLIVEEKLSSITCLENKNVEASAKTQEQTTENLSNSTNVPSPEETPLPSETNPVEQPADCVDQPIVEGIKAQDDPRYRKYFKMVQFGVQPEAVKQKMLVEGLLPEILDHPNQILTDDM